MSRKVWRGDEQSCVCHAGRCVMQEGLSCREGFVIQCFSMVSLERSVWCRVFVFTSKFHVYGIVFMVHGHAFLQRELKRIV